MKSTYRAFAYLIALGVLVQAGAVAFAWFDVMNEIDGGAVIDGNYEGNAGHMMHGIVGVTVIPLLALVLLILSFFTKVPGSAKWAGVVFGVTVVQVVLAFVSFGAPVVGALHGINALVLFGVAVMAAKRVGAVETAPAAVPATAGSSV